MLIAGCAAALVVLMATIPARADTPRSEAAKKPLEESDTPRTELSATPLFAAGLMPALGGGVSFASTFRWESLSLALEARMFTSLSTRVGGDVLVTANVAMPALDVCGHRGFLSVCAVFDAGELRITSEDGVRIESFTPWVSSAGLRVGGDWQFSDRLGLRGLVELHAQYSRPSVWVNNEEVWQAPLLFGVAGVGLVFPVGWL